MEEDLAKTIGYWDSFFDELRQQHTKYDRKMATEYLKRHDLARYDVRFLFKAGDLVLLRQRQAGKLATRARGPYTFGS